MFLKSSTGEGVQFKWSSPIDKIYTMLVPVNRQKLKNRPRTLPTLGLGLGLRLELGLGFHVVS